jgi:hypothetical protein
MYLNINLYIHIYTTFIHYIHTYIHKYKNVLLVLLVIARIVIHFTYVMPTE